jgi:transcriptional regulator with XRE-family HTH domain
MEPTETLETRQAARFIDEAADDEFIQAIGRRVREARARRGMTRKTLALNADVSERYLAQVESGETNPSILVLRHVVHALGISLIELLEPQQISSESRLISRFLEQLSPSRLEEALLRLMHGRTSFVIAHRLSTIRNADQIVVLERGRVIETGTHDELVEHRGRYFAMLQVQLHTARDYAAG